MTRIVPDSDHASRSRCSGTSVGTERSLLDLVTVLGGPFQRGVRSRVQNGWKRTAFAQKTVLRSDQEASRGQSIRDDELTVAENRPRVGPRGPEVVEGGQDGVETDRFSVFQRVTVFGSDLVGEACGQGVQDGDFRQLPGDQSDAMIIVQGSDRVGAVKGFLDAGQGGTAGIVTNGDTVTVLLRTGTKVGQVSKTEKSRSSLVPRC
jgi:hypothetical protein